MTLQPQALFAHDFGSKAHRTEPRDAIIYALGVGLGVDERDLPFMNEKALSVLPTFGVTLASPGMWIANPEFGVDFTKLVHFEQKAWFPESLPPQADIVGEASVLSLTDRGEGKGAVLIIERTIRDRENDTLYCRLHQTLLLRGDGGFGGQPAPVTPSIIPLSDAPIRTSFQTSPRAALIYRLSGDWNPLHLDPAFARKAGFERPILQGLASYGIAGVAVSRACGHEPDKVTMLSCRFSGVVLPGEMLEFHIHPLPDGSTVFQAYVGTRKVLDQGSINWRD